MYCRKRIVQIFMTAALAAVCFKVYQKRLHTPGFDLKYLFFNFKSSIDETFDGLIAIIAL
jgi:hypothetical protein